MSFLKTFLWHLVWWKDFISYSFHIHEGTCYDPLVLLYVKAKVLTTADLEWEDLLISYVSLDKSHNTSESWFLNL